MTGSGNGGTKSLKQLWDAYGEVDVGARVARVFHRR